MPAAKARRTPPPSEEEIPPMESTTEKRTAKMQQLEIAVESIYTMIYGGMVVMPGPIGLKIKPVGNRLKEYTPQIAGAWIDLAEEDAKVRRVLESFANIGGWGKVIGLHLYVVGGQMLPAFAGMSQPQAQQPFPSQAGGESSAQDIQALMALAEFMAQGAAQERTQGNGAEQPTPQTGPMRQTQQQPQPQPQAPPQQPQTRPAAGMPSAAELGVQVADLPIDFPGGSAQDVKGK